jgi:hypothetical protein
MGDLLSKQASENYLIQCWMLKQCDNVISVRPGPLHRAVRALSPIVTGVGGGIPPASCQAGGRDLQLLYREYVDP